MQPKGVHFSYPFYINLLPNRELCKMEDANPTNTLQEVELSLLCKVCVHFRLHHKMQTVIVLCIFSRRSYGCKAEHSIHFTDASLVNCIIGPFVGLPVRWKSLQSLSLPRRGMEHCTLRHKKKMQGIVVHRFAKLHQRSCCKAMLCNPALPFGPYPLTPYPVGPKGSAGYYMHL